jgi:alkylation response protein AidB-like acyl-CoA dehydrogenase
MARTGEDGPRGISAFVVEKDTPGLSFGANEKKMGWNAQPTRTVVLDGARVPAANRLGPEGKGFSIAMAGLDGGRLNIAACLLGGAQAALDRTLVYMGERKAFGQALSEFQALQFRLADAATELEVARTFLWRAATALDAKAADATKLCAMAKLFVTDVSFNAANEALRRARRYGYLAEYGVRRSFRSTVHQIRWKAQRLRVIIACVGATPFLRASDRDGHDDAGASSADRPVDRWADPPQSSEGVE